MTRMTYIARTVLTLAAFASLLAIPAAAQEYQVSVSLADNTFPAPLSYTFDTTTPFLQSGGFANYTNLSVVWDSQCNSQCSVVEVDYNQGGSTIKYKSGFVLLDWGVGCVDVLGSGSCTTDPFLDITHVGTYQTLTGKIVVSAVPEPGTCLELAGIGFSLAFVGFRRFSRGKKSA